MTNQKLAQVTIIVTIDRTKDESIKDQIMAAVQDHVNCGDYELEAI